MASKNKSKQKSSKGTRPAGRAAPVTVASSRKTRTKSADLVLCPHCGYRLQGIPSDGNCPECGKDPANGPELDPTSRFYGRIVIAITLVAILVPIVFAVIHIADSIPAQSAPDLFTPWWVCLIGLGVIAISWISYGLWAVKRRSMLAFPGTG
ncbi:MAG: hypothetical protein VX527_04420 [Planctomycetota bacterium]|nr:hypothetical protein [Planctomycetota bacterium]